MSNWIPGGGFDEFEIEKYKKKTKSNTSKSNRKSKHKHIKANCLIECHTRDYKGRNCTRYYPTCYCEICGKVMDIKFGETEKTDKGYYRQLSDEEVLEKHKDWNIVLATEDNIYDMRYIPIEVND